MADRRHRRRGELDPLYVTRAESDPDEVITVHEYGDCVVTFGERSTEYWDNPGAADFPFERVDTKNVGCGAKNSVAMVGQTLFFIAHDRTVCMLQGYDAARVEPRCRAGDWVDLGPRHDHRHVVGEGRASVLCHHVGRLDVGCRAVDDGHDVRLRRLARRPVVQ